MWNQVYNPLGNAALSTVAAAIPVVTLLVLIASGKVKAHLAAIIAVILTNLIAIFIFTMPPGMSIRASLLGIVAGFFPIGWIVLNVIFLYQITVATGKFELLKRAVGGVTEDRRLQLLLIAFSFGAFFEGLGPDRPWFLAARRFRPVAHRQYRAGCLWRTWHADPGPRFGDRP
jgi:lactate permease